MNRHERRKQEKIFRKIYNSSPKMIHERSYVPMNCVMCDTKMKTIHDTHNPLPITESCTAKESHETGSPNRCCSKCNETVIESRLSMFGVNLKNVVRDKIVPNDMWSVK